MGKYPILTHQTISPEEKHRHLAAAYALILSWPERLENETTGSENFDEDTDPAVENAPTKESDANEV